MTGVHSDALVRLIMEWISTDEPVSYYHSLVAIQHEVVLSSFQLVMRTAMLSIMWFYIIYILYFFTYVISSLLQVKLITLLQLCLYDIYNLCWYKDRRHENRHRLRELQWILGCVPFRMSSGNPRLS